MLSVSSDSHSIQIFLCKRRGNTGIALGAWVSGGISGGHINPAVGIFYIALRPLFIIFELQVTLALAVFRKFPWKKVPAFIFAQVMGGLCGAAMVYANYFHAIDLFEGGRGIRTVPGTASIFSTYAVSYIMLVHIPAFIDIVTISYRI